MEEITITTDERLNRLERELAKTKRYNRMLLAGAVLYLGISGVTLGWVAQKLRTRTAPSRLYQGIRARRFILNDQYNNPRAVLDVTENGGPGLYLYDEQGEIRASLYLTKEGKPWLDLAAENGKPQAMLNVTEKGGKAYLYNEQDNILWKAP